MYLCVPCINILGLNISVKHFITHGAFTIILVTISFLWLFRLVMDRSRPHTLVNWNGMMAASVRGDERHDRSRLTSTRNGRMALDMCPSDVMYRHLTLLAINGGAQADITHTFEYAEQYSISFSDDSGSLARCNRTAKRPFTLSKSS